MLLRVFLSDQPLLMLRVRDLIFVNRDTESESVLGESKKRAKILEGES
jgi:hypothetical protein